MEWDWIDFESGILTVGKSKTKAGTGRKIPIPPQLKSELIKHKLKRQNDKYIFVRVKNNNLPMDENAFYHAWHNFCREMDIANGATVYRNQITKSTLAPDLEPYLLRHTFCTDCQAAGVPLNVAKELMGHSDISVTANSAAAEGVGALKSATKSAIVKSVSCPTAEITGNSES